MFREIGVFSNTYMYNDKIEANKNIDIGIYGIEEVLKGISMAGFKYVELVSTYGKIGHLFPKPFELDKLSAAKNLDLFKKYDLKLNCLYYYQGENSCFLDDRYLDIFKKVIYGATLLNLNFITTDCDAVNTAEKEKKFYKNVISLSEYASIYNIIICIDIHGNWFCNGKKASEIIKKVNCSNIKINYCTGNAIYWGDTNPEDDIKYALPYIGRMHLKDSKGLYKDYNFPAIGDGVVNFVKIFEIIENTRIPISVEVELDGEDNSLDEINIAVSKSFNYLKRIVII